MESTYKHLTLCIIIPMHNEEQGAAKCIDEVVKVISNLRVKTKLIVVNDGSKDKTLKILQKQNSKYKNKLIIISYHKNLGYGGALRTGIKEGIKLQFDYGIIMDSDLTNDPKFIPQFVNEIPNGYDCVKASRYVKGGKVINVPFKRQIISIVGNTFASLFFHVNIRDCTNGFRMIKLSSVRDIPYKENDFSHILEELYYLKKKHAAFKEIPVTLLTRHQGASHFNYTPSIFWHYFKYTMKAFLVKV